MVMCFFLVFTINTYTVNQTSRSLDELHSNEWLVIEYSNLVKMLLY